MRPFFCCLYCCLYCCHCFKQNNSCGPVMKKQIWIRKLKPAAVYKVHYSLFTAQWLLITPQHSYFSSTLRVETEQMLPILFSIYHRLKFNLSWCAQRFLSQYAYILTVHFACCAALLLPGGGRWRGQISSLARSLLNDQLEFISLEDNNSHRAQWMSSVLLLFASKAPALRGEMSSLCSVQAAWHFVTFLRAD